MACAASITLHEQYAPAPVGLFMKFAIKFKHFRAWRRVHLARPSPRVVLITLLKGD